MTEERRIRRRFTQEEKVEIVKLVINDKKTVSEVTRIMDIDRQTIHRWLSEYREVGEKAFVDKSILPRDVLIKKQERLLKEKDEEIAILKKAVAYFAKQKKKNTDI